MLAPNIKRSSLVTNTPRFVTFTQKANSRLATRLFSGSNSAKNQFNANANSNVNIKCKLMSFCLLSSKIEIVTVDMDRIT